MKRYFPGAREVVVARAVSAALHLLYKHLRGLPLGSSLEKATARPEAKRE